MYLRVYNDQPDFEISEPETFCVSLVDFLSHLVRSPHDVASDVQASGSLLKTSEHKDDADSELHDEQQSSEDSVTSDVKLVGKDYELFRNLQYGLTSLQVRNYLSVLASEIFVLLVYCDTSIF